MSEWIDTMGTSSRPDGAKIGEFLDGNEYVWWGYPPGWKPRGGIDAIGPFRTRQEAKIAITSWLGLDKDPI
jgi:hypothetical protein